MQRFPNFQASKHQMTFGKTRKYQSVGNLTILIQDQLQSKPGSTTTLYRLLSTYTNDRMVLYGCELT